MMFFYLLNQLLVTDSAFYRIHSYIFINVIYILNIKYKCTLIVFQYQAHFVTFIYTHTSVHIMTNSPYND